MNEISSDLVTTYAFKGGKQYVVKMKVASLRGCQRCLELTVTDKYTGEHWQSSYDTTYIENLTQKTGNYKQFNVFVAMLQSGLLKTSECITLDLLTFEDLELLRAKRVEGTPSAGPNNKISNRRYLILTYTVEFDRIHYPLPLEYCGLPDPITLQATIRRLQSEIERLQSTGSSRQLHRRVEQLTTINQKLVQENHRLSSSGYRMQQLLNTVKSLENSVRKERASFHSQIQRLRSENAALTLKIRQLSTSNNKRAANSPIRKRTTSPLSISQGFRAGSRRSRSNSPSITGCFSRLSSPGSTNTSRVQSSSHHSDTKLFHARRKNSKVDIQNLESRIHVLQKMLQEGINLK